MLIKNLLQGLYGFWRSFAKSDIYKVTCYCLLYKAAFFLLVYLSFHMLPFSEGSLRANLNYPENSPITFMTALKTWDGQHYHYLAENGYSAQKASNAFYPLYPLLTSLVAKVFGIDTVLSGVLLSNFLSVGAVIFLYLLSLNFMNRRRALTVILLFLSYPVAFYSNIFYSESLFLFLVLGLLYGLYRDKFWLAVAFALLLPLSRPQGILIGLVILVFYFCKYGRGAINPLDKKEALLLFLFPYGVAFYFLLMYLGTGDFAAGFNAQKHFISGNSIMNIFDVRDWFVRNFLAVDISFHGFTNSVIDRVFFVFFVISLYFIYMKTDLTLTAYSLIVGLIPALSGSFMSYSRYTLIIFPIFMALSLAFRRQYCMVAAVLFASTQAVFAIRHTLNHWMG